MRQLLKITMKHFTFLIALVLSFMVCNLQAATSEKQEEKRITNNVTKLFTNDDEQKFYPAVEEQRTYWLNKGDMTKFFESFHTQAIYDINWGHSYRAMQTIRNLTAEIRQRKLPQYNYIADNLLGILYLYRGNNEVAVTYFKKALNEVTDKQKKNGDTNNIYVSLSNALTDNNPKMAEFYNNKIIYGKNDTYTKSGVLAYGAMIAYVQKDKSKFMRYYDKYMALRKKDSVHFCNGNYTYVIANYYMINGQYDKALKYCDSFMDPILINQMKSDIYKLKGDYRMAYRYLNIKDSIQLSQNTKLLVDDVNDLSHALDITDAQAHQARSRMIATISFICLAIVVLLVGFFHLRNHYKRNDMLERHNRQLKVAHERLSRAIKMRRAYIDNVREQIKSPLRILSDYSRIFNNEKFNLSDQEKQEAVNNIENNVNTIESMLGSVVSLYQQADTDGGLTDEQTNYAEQCQTALRTPLNTISGFAQIMGSNSYEMSDEERAELMKTIASQASVISQSIGQLMNLSHADSINHAEKEDRVTLNSVCRAALDNYDLHNHALEKVFKTTVPDDEELKTNYEMLNQMLNCLLNNADKFTTTGNITINCEQTNTSYLIQISDTGIGVNEEAAPKIFDRFYKADPNTDGLGLGLSLCARLAHLLGYAITLDSNYKGGARFCISIPV